MRTKIFTIAFTVAYVIAYQSGFAAFRYYPALQRISVEALPASTSGPAMLWYGWVTCALAVSLLAALVVPRRLAERVPPALTWIAPTIGAVAVIVHERGWFW